MIEQFTPGPWQRGAGATVITQPQNDGDFKIWKYWPICDAAVGQKPIEEQEANAALIAAAPELYKELEKHCALCVLRHPERERCKLCETRKVLNKARGRK